MKKVLGIDPGLSGAFVLTDGESETEILLMPVVSGKEKRVDFGRVLLWLEFVKKRFGVIPVFLERAKPLAMGSKFAFNYGRDFEKIVLAIHLSGLKKSLRQVEPSAWTKEMHQGLSPDLKPKAKSLIAVEKLCPHLVGDLPRRPKGALMDGPVDALLIAGYGIRCLKIEKADF